MGILLGSSVGGPDRLEPNLWNPIPPHPLPTSVYYIASLLCAIPYRPFLDFFFLNISAMMNTLLFHLAQWIIVTFNLTATEGNEDTSYDALHARTNRKQACVTSFQITWML